MSNNRPPSANIRKRPKKQMMLFSGRANPGLAQEVAAQLGTELVPTSAYDFANGEIYVRFEESVRGSDAFVIQSHTAPINECDHGAPAHGRRAQAGSAKRITVVMPFYGYARQDKKHRGREPISARLMADMFKTAGADRLICVDLHTDQIQGFFDGPVDHLMAIPILSEYVASEVRRPGPRGRLAGRRPDQGRRAVVEAARRRAAGLHPQDPRHQPAQRDGRQPGRRPRARPGLRARRRHDRHRRHHHQGRRRAHGRRRQGGRHRGDPRDPQRARPSSGSQACAAEEVIVTNTLPIPDEKQIDGSRCSRSPRSSATAIKEVFEDGSVTSLFGGRA